MDPSGLDWFVSSDGRNFACLTQSEISSLGSKIKGGCFDGFDVGTCCNVGPTYNFQTSDGTSYICADNCQVYRKDAYDIMKQNQQNGITTPQWMLKDGLASQLKIIGNISLQNRSNFLGPSGITYNISDFEPPTELPIPLTGLNVSEITIEPLPGIDMNISTNVSDATNVATSSSMPNVSYSFDPQTFFEQGGSSSGVNGSLSSLISGTSSAVTAAGAFSSYKQYSQYSNALEIWRGTNGVIYHGLNGRGPNGFTGSRAFAESRSARFGIGSNILTVLGISITYAQYKYDMSNNPGPNLRHYLEMRYKRDQLFNFSGFFRIYGAAVSLGYNSGYLIEFLTGKNIQLNPYTNDFTPIEETLTKFDNNGIYLYNNE